MSTLYLVCGPPFSGKTTLAKKITQITGYKYVSTDDIMRNRGFDLSKKNPVEEWEKTHQECFKILNNLMKENHNIVLDDTNFLKKLRDRFRDMAHKQNYKIVTIYVDISLEELEKRRKNAVEIGNRKNLDDDAFYPVVNAFEKPDESENTIMYTLTDTSESWISKYISF